MTNINFHTTPPATVELVYAGNVAIPLATVTRGYSGVYESYISEQEVRRFIDDLQATKLHTPNSFINMIWLIKDVTRSFTHQLVRYRVGTSFVQESLRFSEKRDCNIYVPQNLSPAGRERFEAGCRAALEAYNDLVEGGEAVQDARGILPTNVCTHIFCSINLQTLSHIYEQRACCQAQADEWTVVLDQMQQLLLEHDPVGAEFLKAPWENPNCVNCGFNASFDRPCKHQHLFDQNLNQLIAAKEQRDAQAPRNS